MINQLKNRTLSLPLSFLLAERTASTWILETRRTRIGQAMKTRNVWHEVSALFIALLLFDSVLGRYSVPLFSFLSRSSFSNSNDCSLQILSYRLFLFCSSQLIGNVSAASRNDVSLNLPYFSCFFLKNNNNKNSSDRWTRSALSRCLYVSFHFECSFSRYISEFAFSLPLSVLFRWYFDCEPKSKKAASYNVFNGGVLNQSQGAFAAWFTSLT